MGKRRRLGEYKRNSGWVWEENECKVRQQEKLDIVEEKDIRKRELLENVIVKMLYRWNDENFEEKYLRKLERNWWK